MMTALGTRLGREDERVAELAGEIAEIDEVVRKVTEATDPEAERKELSRRRVGLDNRLRASQAADAKTAADLSGAAARLESSKQAHNKAESDVAVARAEAGTAAVAAGFPHVVTAAEAELSRADEQQLSTRVEAPVADDYRVCLHDRDRCGSLNGGADA